MTLNLHICRVMHWSYADLLSVPVDVYDVLVDEVLKPQEED